MTSALRPPLALLVLLLAALALLVTQLVAGPAEAAGAEQTANQRAAKKKQTLRMKRSCSRSRRLRSSKSPRIRRLHTRRFARLCVVRPARRKDRKLSWRPPALSSPTTVVIDDSTPMPLSLDTAKDYVIKLGHRTRTRGVVISGGRNIVMIGGRISIPYAGASASIASRRGLYLERNAGTVHIEGLLIDGPDLSEGIQIAAPNAVVQLQRVRIVGVHARDQVNFTDNHPDCLQPWGGVRRIKVDRMTCSTDTHGMYWDSNDARRLGGPIGHSDIRRYNMKRTLKSPHWAFQRVTQDGDQPMVLTDVYVEPEDSTSLYNSVGNEPWRNRAYNFLRATMSADGQTASWPQDGSLTGSIKKGPPPGGDFAPAGGSGTRYASPGYVQ